jgi:5-hydroxyisourate hydrolase
MSNVTTHILDTSIGRPAAGVAVILDIAIGASAWQEMGRGVTDNDGRLRTLSPADGLRAGTYRIRFDTGDYFKARGIDAFYPEVSVTFALSDAAQHYHVPLLLSPFGYSTYRGS